ncbi:MAG: SIMPL domain-containing protein [Planctomycetaceae bacterium]
MSRTLMLRCTLWPVCWLAAIAMGGTAGAAENPGIAVVGSGKTMAKPTVVELTAIVKGEAELAVDAITKYEDNKRRALEAITNLGIADLSVSGGGVSINSADAQAAMMAAMRGMPPAEDATQKLSLSETLTLQLKIAALSTQDLLQTLVKIVDAGKDAGLTIGPPTKSMYEMQIAAQMGNSQSPLAAFKLEDVATAKGQAYEAAITDARSQAERLANLAGVKLGKVTAIREVTDRKQNEREWNPYYGWMMQTKDKEYVSSGLKEIPVAVVLEVEFAIE